MLSAVIAFVAFWIILPSLVGALLLRAAVATSNRLRKSSDLLKELTFLACLNTMFVACLIDTMLFWFLPANWSLPSKVLVAFSAKWLFVCFSLAEQLQTSIDRVLVIVGLLFLYIFLCLLPFAVAYLLVS